MSVDKAAIALRELVDAMTGRIGGETVALHNALAVLAEIDSKPATEQAEPDSLRDHIRRAHMKLSCAQEAAPLARTVLVSEALKSLDAAMATQPARAPLSPEELAALKPQPFSNAELERLYANIEPSAQQDARSREAFKRISRIVERAHGIGEAG